jgi:dTDP-4-amino-4,6-dideoxygalactose transaminase
MNKQATVQPSPAPIPAAKIDFLPEDRQWIADRIQEVLATGQLTLGKYGASFENGFAALCGVNHGIAVNSGTSALEIILRALGVGDKDVLIPTNSFFATAAAVVHAGGKPVFTDTDPATLATTPEEILAALTPNTAAIVVVHIGGLVSPRMPEIALLAKNKGIHLVEDAAHAHGSSYQGTMAGAFGAAAAFSFYPTKVMTSGEGGMIVTDDEAIAREARIYRDQGKSSFTENVHTRLGYNWRLSEPHAIIGLRHLERLPSMIEQRRRIAAIYNRELAGLSWLKPLPTPADCKSNYYKYVAMIDKTVDRKALKAMLRERYAVSLSGEVYEAPLHQQPIFGSYAAKPLPLSENVCRQHVCLPVFASMTDAQADQVVSALLEVQGK